MTTQTATPFNVWSQLIGVGVPIRIEYVAERSLDERRQALAWAMGVVQGFPEIADRPEWLPGRDVDASQQFRKMDETEYQRLRLRYLTEWKEPAPEQSLGDKLVELGYDELAADLALSGVNLEDTDRNTEVEWLLFADTLLGVVRDEIRELTIERQYAAQYVAQIKKRYKALHDGRAQRIADVLALIASRIDRVTTANHRRELANGFVGVRDVPDDLELTDPEACAAWCREHLPAALSTQTYERLEPMALAKAIRGGAQIPGVVWTPEHREAYAEPLPHDEFGSVPVYVRDVDAELAD